MPPSVRFGDVWMVKGGVMGPEPVLVVSSDLYHELSEDNVIIAPIRTSKSPGARVVTEHIPNIGTAVLDRIGSVPRSWFVEHIGAIDSERRETVGRRVKNLIGP